MRPTLWVSHRPAALVHGFGDFIANRPEFIATKRLQARIDARITVRRNGLKRTDWVIREGFAVTSAARTFADLVADVVDGGHLGRFAQDALTGGAAHDDLADAVDDLDALLAMADKRATRSPTRQRRHSTPPSKRTLRRPPRRRRTRSASFVGRSATTGCSAASSRRTPKHGYSRAEPAYLNYRVYPIVDHIADKHAAMLDTSRCRSGHARP